MICIQQNGRHTIKLEEDTTELNIMPLNVLPPSIEILSPLITLNVRMQNKRTPQTSEMKVEVSDFARWKDQDIPRVHLDHQAQLMQHNLPTFPLAKGHNSTEKLVDPVSMSICGAAQVDDHASKGVGDGLVPKAERIAVLLNVLVLLW